MTLLNAEVNTQRRRQRVRWIPSVRIIAQPRDLTLHDVTLYRSIQSWNDCTTLSSRSTHDALVLTTIRYTHSLRTPCSVV